MEKYKCKICGKGVTPKTPYIGSHLKRCHKVSLEDYASKYYSEINTEGIRNCVSCGSQIIPKIKFNFSEGTFEKIYDGYICPKSRNSPSIECKNNISNLVLGLPYNKKTYEYIGSKKEFLSLKYQISSEEAVLLKNIHVEKIKRENPSLSEGDIQKIYKKKIEERDLKPVNNLKGFIQRHGEEKGRKLYNENREKISKGGTLEFYINKYGEEEGMERWTKKIGVFKKNLGPVVSKKSKLFGKKIEDHGIKFIPEYPLKIGKKGIIVDFYIPDSNTVVEFFGDYWHCNPRIYDSDYYHKVMKMTASQKWDLDKKRIDSILESTGFSVLVVWESSNISPDEILSILTDIRGKNTLFVI